MKNQPIIVPQAPTRRSFLLGIAATGVGMVLSSLKAKSEVLTVLPPQQPIQSFEPNMWVKIDSDGTTTITVAKSEMGQGIRTSFAMIIAEEMEADWSKVKIRQARPDYMQNGETISSTEGSNSVLLSYSSLRKIGATVRAMLISAAASKWGITEANCTASNGMISEVNGIRQILYGELTEDAEMIAIPSNPPLKNPAEFTIIGTRKPHIDNPDIVSGKAVYGLDVRIPGMKYAVKVFDIAFGASMKSFDASEALKISGVIKVDLVPGVGYVVLADTTFAALAGRDALKIEWNLGVNGSLNSSVINKQLKSAIGTLADVPANSTKIIEAEFELPFLAHATMEPMNCVADVKETSAEIWCASQQGSHLQKQIATALGIPEDKVVVNITLLGGGFGRRLYIDYAISAALISKMFNVPVLFMFTRKDDMKNDYYRPASYHVCKGGLDKNGVITGIVHNTVNGDANTFPPYQMPKPIVFIKGMYVPIPWGPWRSVGQTSSVFVNECFMDELAFAANKDPFEFRRNMLQDGSSLKNVIEKAAEIAEWTKPLPKGWGRGIACYTWNSDVAHVVEVSVTNGGLLKVERVIAVIDCGIAVNPMGVEAQLQGAIVDALSTALKSEITIENGGVKQSSFRDFEWLRMNEMPKIETYIMPSNREPKGVGEMGFPSVSPALCNAIFNATGKRYRTLPLQKSFLSSVEASNSFSDEEMNVYPNPFHSSFKIDGKLSNSQSGEISISIQNLLGSTLLETQGLLGNEGNFLQEINFSPASAGVYFLTVKNGKSAIMRKIVKE